MPNCWFSAARTRSGSSMVSLANEAERSVFVHRDRDQGGLHTMAGYVEQVDDHVVVVEPVEVEAVTSEDVGRQVARGHRDLPGHLGGQDRLQISRGTAQFGLQTLGERTVAFLADEKFLAGLDFCGDVVDLDDQDLDVPVAVADTPTEASPQIGCPSAWTYCLVTR